MHALATPRFGALALVLVSLAASIPAAHAQPPYRGNWVHGFSPAFAVAAGPNGDVFVADTYFTPRVLVFTGVGDYVAEWGSSGSGQGQFSFPNSIVVGSDQTVYVVDSGNSRVQTFTSAGAFVSEWGSAGSGNGQFNGPVGIAVSGGDVFVGDQGNHRIQKFAAGVYGAQWGTMGTGDGQFITIIDVATDAAGNVYVADAGTNRIQKFTSAGVFVTAWGGLGTGQGLFNGLTGIEVGSNGNVYAVDANHCRVQEFTDAGVFLSLLGGVCGSDNDEFLSPTYVGADALGNIYVADAGNSRIVKFGAGPTPTLPASIGALKRSYQR